MDVYHEGHEEHEGGFAANASHHSFVFLRALVVHEPVRLGDPKQALVCFLAVEGHSAFEDTKPL